MAADLAKLSIQRLRPREFNYQGGVFDTFGPLWNVGHGHGSQSFPSAHVASAVGLAVALCWLYPRGRALFVGLALLACLQRMKENVAYALGNFERDAIRRQAEQALRESEERFRSLVELASDWYWESDAELRLSRLEGRGARSGSDRPRGSSARTETSWLVERARARRSPRRPDTPARRIRMGRQYTEPQRREP